MPPLDPRLIVFERTGRWAAAFRQQAGQGELPIREARSLAQVERELAEQPSAMVALEVNAASLPGALGQLATWRRWFAAARFLLLADPELAPLELALRDAGAVHVVYTTRELAGAVRLVRRHLGRIPRPEMTLKESILARLPWSDRS